MPRVMSNTFLDRVQMKMDVPRATHEKLKKASAETGYTMATIVCLLIEYNLSPTVIEANIRKSLAAYARKNKDELKLSKRQQRIIENGDPSRHEFTKDLI